MPEEQQPTTGKESAETNQWQPEQNRNIPPQPPRANRQSNNDEREPDNHKQRPVVVRFWRILFKQLWIRPKTNTGEIVGVCLIFLVGIIQAAIYWRQADLTKGALEQNERAAILNRGQLITANKNTFLAEQALIASNKAFQMQERAWMGFEITQPQFIEVAPNAQIGAFANVQNFGNTPAVRATTDARMKIFCPDFPKRPSYNDGNNPNFFRGSRATFMPKDVTSTNIEYLDHRLTQKEFSDLTANPAKCVLYFYGKVEYCDAFGVFHYSHHCSFWVPGTKNKFAICASYDDTDTDHPSDPPQPCPKD